MARKLTVKGLQKLNEISDKYRFLNTVELTDDDVYEFIQAFLNAEHLGLNVDDEDINWIKFVREQLYG